MIGDDPRTLVVGATGLVWARITEKTGADLSAATVQLRTVSPSGTLSAWAAPAATDVTQAATGLYRAAAEHIASVVGLWELQAKVGTEILKVGPFQVVAA